MRFILLTASCFEPASVPGPSGRRSFAGDEREESMRSLCRIELLPAAGQWAQICGRGFLSRRREPGRSAGARNFKEETVDCRPDLNELIPGRWCYIRAMK